MAISVKWHNFFMSHDSYFWQKWQKQVWKTRKVQPDLNGWEVPYSRKKSTDKSTPYDMRYAYMEHSVLERI